MSETDFEKLMTLLKSADITFVVRCEDCEHGRLITNPKFYEDGIAPRVYCHLAGKHLSPNHYCSWGIRR